MVAGRQRAAGGGRQRPATADGATGGGHGGRHVGAARGQRRATARAAPGSAWGDDARGQRARPWRMALPATGDGARSARRLMERRCAGRRAASAGRRLAWQVAGGRWRVGGRGAGTAHAAAHGRWPAAYGQLGFGHLFFSFLKFFFRSGAEY